MTATVEASVVVDKKIEDHHHHAEHGTAPSQVRYTILILTILCLSTIMANIVAFNFTVLCMPATHEVLAVNQTAYHGYSKNDRTYLFTAVAVGALIAVVPMSHAITVFGGKKVFVMSGLLSLSATIFIPISAQTHFGLFLAMRFLQGVSFAACMPMVGKVTSSWASLAQNGLFMGVLTTFGQLSAVFSMPVSGELCVSSFGWTSVYYVHAAVCFVAFSLWAYIYKDSPDSHSWVSKSELILIQDGKTESQNSGHAHTIPYLSIFTTPAIWAIWIGALGDLIAVQLVHTFSPLYMREVLQYSVTKTGFAAALPVLFQFLVKVFAGHSSDKITRLTETTKLRIYNSIALGASAAFMIALAFVQKGQGLIGLILITLTTAMFGFNGGGFNKCATLVSRQYSPFVLANIQFIWCLSMLICPILVSLLLPTGAPSEWRVVYLVHAAILVLSNVVFCIWATAKPATWTDPTIQENGLASKKSTPIFQLKPKVGDLEKKAVPQV